MFIFKDYVEKYVPKAFESDIGSKIKNADSKYSIIPLVLIIILILILNSDIGFTLNFRYLGIGFYLLILGVICLGVHPFIYKGNMNVLEEQISNINSSGTNTYNQNNVQVQNPTMQAYNQNVNIQPVPQIQSEQPVSNMQPQVQNQNINMQQNGIVNNPQNNEETFTINNNQ